MRFALDNAQFRARCFAESVERLLQRWAACNMQNFTGPASLNDYDVIGFSYMSTIAQAIIGSVILFIGIVCQFWAGSNVADIPLSTLCSTYSGAPDGMGVDDFNKFFNWLRLTNTRAAKV